MVPGCEGLERRAFRRQPGNFCLHFSLAGYTSRPKSNNPLLQGVNGMARVTVEDCIDKVENRFELVLLAGTARA